MKQLSFRWIIVLSALCLSAQLTPSLAGPGDTVRVQTFRFDTNMRSGMFQFPDDTSKTWEKITMLYSMRCKNGLVSTGSNTNLGCGEWDYNCYTYLIDSAQTDSLRLTHPDFSISNFNGSTYYFTGSPVYQYFQTQQQTLIHNSIISQDSSLLGTGSQSCNHPINAVQPVSRAQYLWTAADLIAAGLQPGPVSGLMLQITGATGFSLNNFRIRIKSTTSDSLQAGMPELFGFTEVYFSNTQIANPGPQDFVFLQNFTWDGTSNLIIEFSYTNPSSLNTGIPAVAGDPVAPGLSLRNEESDAYLWLNHNGQFIDVPSTALSNINNEVTVAFWVYGNPTSLPANTTILEGVDPANQRQLNIHLPWSDSNIYFDCGNTAGSYDRINLGATVSDLEGKWNFWAFTKNAVTGTMKIYLNGNLWHSGTGKTRPINLTGLKIGTSYFGSLGWYGGLNDFSLWNKELTQPAIQQIMHASISPSHPDYANLQAYYPLNEGSGTTITDASSQAAATQVINPSWRDLRGQDLLMNFSDPQERPALTLFQGVYQDTVITTTVLDSILAPGVSVISYQVVSNNLTAIDTVYGWQAGQNFVLDANGNVADTLFVNPTDTFSIGSLTYYQRRPMRVELINFITPYGINLNLNGLIGKTWEFDVTDYAPVLRGKKSLAMADGIYQEDNDITFIFKEGTPPRPVKSIQQIWPSGSWVFPSYSDIVNNKYFEPRTLPLSSSAASFKIRSAISGHGQEGEFIPRNHTLRINNNTDFTRQVWTTCGNNPIYPQGGTWVYDRAGWCPGAAVDVAEYDLNGIAGPGQNMEIDYLLPANSNPGSSTYRVNNQLVSYGAASFTSDAALEEIIKPSKRTEYARFNPLCDRPQVVIRNTGSQTLTSVTIMYGRKGGVMSSYQWTGSLEFMKTSMVELPSPDWQSSNQPEFIAYVKNPNAGADQYAWNDTLSSGFDGTPYYSGKHIFEIKTNNYGYENEYTLKDAANNIIIYRGGLSPNTTYRDTVQLPTGCYTVYLTDQGGDGLSFWANTAQGTGFFRIRDAVTNQIVKSFNADFGNNVYHQFTVNYILPVQEQQNTLANSLNVYPNPASDDFLAELVLPMYSNAHCEVMNSLGQVVLQEEVRVTNEVEKISFDTRPLAEGVYVLRVTAGEVVLTKRIQVVKS